MLPQYEEQDIDLALLAIVYTQQRLSLGIPTKSGAGGKLGALCKIGTLLDAMYFLASLAETGSGGAWPKNVSALWSHPQEMPVRPVGVYADGKAASC